MGERIFFSITEEVKLSVLYKTDPDCNKYLLRAVDVKVGQIKLTTKDRNLAKLRHPWITTVLGVVPSDQPKLVGNRINGNV